MITIKDLLAKSQDNYIKAGEGTFKCALSKIEKSTSKAGKPIVILTFKVIEGESKEATFNHYMSYSNDRGIEIVARQLCVLATKNYGIKEERIEEDAEEVVDLIYNAVAEISKKLNKKNVEFEVVRTKDGDFYTNKWKVIEQNVADAVDDDAPVKAAKTELVDEDTFFKDID